MENPEILKKLTEGIRNFSKISTEKVSDLYAIAEIKTFKRNVLLIEFNKPCKYIFFVLEGLLASKYLMPNGETHIKNFFCELDFATSTVSALTNEPSKFSIETLEKTTVLIFSYEEYKQLIMNSEELMKFYVNYLEQKWVIENEYRQLSFATQTAEERYKRFLINHYHLLNRVSLHNIASYLGITPTQLSRIRKNYKFEKPQHW